VDSKEIDNIKKIFKTIDKNKDGKLSFAELREGLSDFKCGD
jgi:Ca2+-binding EF-hand superfamily protein